MKNHLNSCGKTRYTIDYYSNKWSRYDIGKLRRRIENFEPLLRFILKISDIKPDMKILDVGTGLGTVPILILEKFEKISDIKIYGIDPSPIAISNATKFTKEYGYQKAIEYKLGSFEDIPFPEKSFDLIISNASFNLCTNKIKAIDEMYRVVKNKGQIIIADCFRKEKECKSIQEDNEELWAHCITGAVTTGWLIANFKEKNIIFIKKEELTEIVRSMVLKEQWKWREFIEYNLEYYSLLFHCN
ncbi:MAG: class I SAM-dependent methyltransferase [Promethearchaeota archaeon]